MKHSIGKNILISVLAVITMFSLFTLIDEGRNFIGANYFDSESFNAELSSFESSIVPLVLAVPDKEKVKKNITVTPDEIEEYRFRYGNLESQLESIKNQYAGNEETTTTVESADDGTTTEKTETETDKAFEEASKLERDKKIADITKNFTDDSYVENKIRLEKEAQVDAYFKSIEQAKNDFINENEDFSYSLKNTETGERFTNGEVTAKNAYKKEYSGKYGYLKKSTIYDGVDDYSNMRELIDNGYARFEGVVTIPEASILSGYRASEYKHFLSNQRKFYGVLLVGILAAIAFTILWRKNSESFRYETNEQKYRKLPIDVKLALIFISGFIAIISSKEIIWSFFYYGGYDIPIISFLFAVLFTALTLYQWKWMRAGFGSIDWKRSLIYSWGRSLEGFFLKQSIGVQTLIMLIVVFFWGFGTMLLFVQPVVIVVWIPATLLIGIPVLLVLLSRMAYLNHLFVKSEQMAKGVIGNEIEVKGKSPVAEHAASLNGLRDRIKSSHSEQAKSERLKTELITNVSHDLRTPLTSIITYTDLLKNPSITDEERASYIAILDKKSMRLKTLIEDLFEVSKMASGNMELDKRKVDLTQLLQQAVAEHQEDIDKSGLEYRVAIGTKPIMAYVDGQKWWRVLDNLIINTLKYALPNTRVYINLDQVNGEAVFVIKNIAKYELGDDVNELTERFKRADTSRHTEGSGLGLAIAQSIVDLHDGSLRMEVDGDLFKVTVKIAVI
ncbi:histidine kinase dimerization/phospho-acceptor domain-containing protein [Bacillus sp. FJAT-22090]|uniref:histidine kinase dimerization/phospho-acceptor domain-containing protein n=1 Tax=Bacillus sp. FJAT-22090 TaxID=1581038 RepID=UPI0011A5765C|nr:histidine kinase dimerization/phospho-acceptor domain-containing protein [Bacillus sp. FJAT-22090]